MIITAFWLGLGITFIILFIIGSLALAFGGGTLLIINGLEDRHTEKVMFGIGALFIGVIFVSLILGFAVMASAGYGK